MPLAPQRTWILPRLAIGDVPDGIPDLICRILRSRGLADAEMPAFIDARALEPGPPMLDLERAVARIRHALRAKERIVV